jgi:hypothetical protein
MWRTYKNKIDPAWAPMRFQIDNRALWKLLSTKHKKSIWLLYETKYSNLVREEISTWYLVTSAMMNWQGRSKEASGYTVYKHFWPGKFLLYCTQDSTLRTPCNVSIKPEVYPCIFQDKKHHNSDSFTRKRLGYPRVAARHAKNKNKPQLSHSLPPYML